MRRMTNEETQQGIGLVQRAEKPDFPWFGTASVKLCVGIIRGVVHGASSRDGNPGTQQSKNRKGWGMSSIKIGRRFTAAVIWRSLLIVLSGLPGGVTHASPLEGAWSGRSIGDAVAAANRRGRHPAYEFSVLNPGLGTPAGRLEDDGGAASGNYQLDIPLVAVPGRGLDLGVRLSYNAQLWSTVEGDLTFNPDGDWPAPGWQIGFGKMMYPNLMIEANGTRRPLRITSSSVGPDGVTRHGVFDDDSLVRFECRRCETAEAGIYVTYPGRGVIEMRPSASWNRNDQVFYPVQIVDANGNYLTIEYLRDAAGKRLAPRIDTITDTVGRVVQFHYDSNQRLLSVSRPAVNGGRQIVARLFYETRPYYLPVPQPRAAQQYDALSTIFFPGNRSAYRLTDYTEYGMPRELHEYRATQVATPTLTDQGSVVAFGQLNRKTAFNYRAIRRLTETPVYTRRTVTWYDGDTQAGQAVTRYATSRANGIRRITVTNPDGSRSVQHAKDGARTFDDGLVYLVERKAAGNRLLGSMAIEWELGHGGKPRQRAVTAFDDEAGGSVRHEYSYGANNQQVIEDRVIDSSDGVVMRSVTRYLDDPVYAGLNLINLPSSVHVYEGANARPSSRTEFVYDEYPLRNISPANGHRLAFRDSHKRVCSKYETVEDINDRPRQACVAWKRVLVPAPRIRGNLTTLRVYANAVAGSGAIETHYYYDVAGNMVQSKPQTGAVRTVSFSATTDYSQPEQVAFGSTVAASTERVTERYSYDAATGLVSSHTNHNGRTSTFEYVPGALGERLQFVRQQSGALLQFTYDDDALTLRRDVIERTGATPITSITRLDGGGQARETTVTAQAGIVRSVFEYDAIGRLEYESLPFTSGQPQRSHYRYDAAGRLVETTHPDGSVLRQTYNPASVPDGVLASDIGQSVLLEDAWGRQRWMKYDRLGRLTLVVQPNPAGSGSVYDTGSQIVRYRYDVFGRLGAVRQGPQMRFFNYDSLGRLICQAVPERDRTLLPSGATDPARRGACSDVWLYNDSTGNVTHVDPRGVHTITERNNDPLERLRAIRYDLSHVSDTSSPITPVPAVRYEYRGSGNVLLLERIVTGGFATESFSYDTDGELADYALLLNAYPRAPLTLGYQHDHLGRRTLLRYPARVPLLHRSTRPQLDYGYHPTGELATLSMGGASLAFDLHYGPGRQLTGMKLNSTAGVLEEVYEIDRFGAIVGQQVKGIGGVSVMSLGYGYERQIRAGGAAPQGMIYGRTGQLVNIEDRLDATRTRGFRYDSLGRLKEASRGAQIVRPSSSSYEWLEYGYDPFGNRTSVRAFAPGSRTPCRWLFGCPAPAPRELPIEQRDGLGDQIYDAATNRLTGPAARYDAAGNLILVDRGDGYRQRYVYDAAGRLVKVTDTDDGLIEEYRYASDRRRIGFSRDFNRWTYTLWDGSKPVARYAAGPTGPLIWAGYDIYAGASLLQTITPGAAASTRTFVHRAPQFLALSIDGPGGLRHQVEPLQPFGFTNKPATDWPTTQLFDEYERGPVSRIDSAPNRNYDSRYGRFNETDPLGNLGLNHADPQTLNLYVYAHNDPVNGRDPLGLLDGEAPPCDRVKSGGCLGGNNEFCWKDEGGSVSCGSEPIVITGPSTGPSTGPLTAPAPIGFDSWYSSASSKAGSKGRDLAKKAGCMLQKAARMVLSPVAETVKTVQATGISLPEVPYAVGDRISTTGSICFGGCTAAGYFSIARHVSLSTGQDSISLSYGFAIPGRSWPDHVPSRWDSAQGMGIIAGESRQLSIRSEGVDPGSNYLHNTRIVGAGPLAAEYVNQFSGSAGTGMGGLGVLKILTQTKVIPTPTLDCP